MANGTKRLLGLEGSDRILKGGYGSNLGTAARNGRGRKCWCFDQHISWVIQKRAAGSTQDLGDQSSPVAEAETSFPGISEAWEENPEAHC